jgi:hypothetical protein
VAHRSSSTVDSVAAKLLVLLPVSVVIVVVVVILSVGFWPSPLTLLLLSLSLARTSLASMHSTKQQLHKITTNANVDILDNDDNDDHSSFLYATLLVMVKKKMLCTMMMTLSVWLFVLPLGSIPSHLHTVAAFWKNAAVASYKTRPINLEMHSIWQNLPPPTSTDNFVRTENTQSRNRHC